MYVYQFWKWICTWNIFLFCGLFSKMAKCFKSIFLPLSFKSIFEITIIYHKIINTYLVLCVIQCLPQCPNHQGFHGKKMWLEGDFVRRVLGKNFLLWIETHILDNNKSWKLQCCLLTMDWDSCFLWQIDSSTIIIESWNQMKQNS